MNTKTIIAGVIGIVALIGGAYLLFDRTSPVASSGASRLSVVTSFYPLYFFASQIGGDKAEVVNITPSGAEPHDYEPTAQQIAQIETARLLILNGGGLEGWGDKIKQNIDQNKTTVIVAGEGLTTQQVVEEGETVTDPHVWLSPPLAMQVADRIAQGFESADPANASLYRANADALKTRLANLDAAYKAGLSSCTKKEIITSHAAFGYLATAYRLKQVAIAGVSPDAEPSAQELAAVADFAKKNDVKVIFFESLVSPKLSQTIAKEVGAQTMVLDPIEGISEEDVAAGKNYYTVMESNLANLKVALQCH